MTAWPTRHTAADWHPTAKGQFRQMTKFREFFPYVGAGAVLLDSSLIPSPPIMPQDRARVDDP